MGQLAFVLRRASTADYTAVHDLLLEASKWLESKHTDQWRRPWPDANGRKERVMGAIKARRTWIAWDGTRAAATLTASPNHHGIWPEELGHGLAVYVRRLVVSRDPGYAGKGLGGQLLDWAGLRANHGYGARWIRVDVWKTNINLHNYYRDQGFQYCGRCPIPDYPSAALFQKSVDDIKPTDPPLFREDPATA